MGMMAQIGINLEATRFQSLTDISIPSPNRLTNHATLTCNLHPDLAPPRPTVFHPTAASTTTTPHARTTTQVFLLTMQIANTTTTTTPRSTSLSPRRLTLHILVMSTALTSDEVQPDVDELTDDVDAAMVEALHQVEDEATVPLNGPETVSI